MTTAELAQILHARRLGPGKWIAKCPAHRDRSPSLAIREGKKAVLLRCWSGCATEDVLKAIGLKMSDLFPNKPSANWREIGRIREKELHAIWESKRSIRHKRLREKGYSPEDMKLDWECAIAIAMMLAEKPSEHLERLLAIKMDNVISFQMGLLR